MGLESQIPDCELMAAKSYFPRRKNLTGLPPTTARRWFEFGWMSPTDGKGDGVKPRFLFTESLLFLHLLFTLSFLMPFKLNKTLKCEFMLTLKVEVNEKV